MTRHPDAARARLLDPDGTRPGDTSDERLAFPLRDLLEGTSGRDGCGIAAKAVCPREAAARHCRCWIPASVPYHRGRVPDGFRANMLVTLENNQLFTKLGNQQAIPMFPESRTMFFPKVVNAEIEFTKAYAPRDERLDSPLGLARMARRPRRGR